MKDWSGQVAFITGGAQGIGLGIARSLASRGVKLALADIDEANLALAATELSGTTEVVTHVLDVRDRERFAKVADDVECTLGPVTLLFNNAGIAPHTSISSVTYEQWDLALGVNLTGVVNGIQTFLPRLIERGRGGHIVNTASGAGLVAGNAVLYTTAKFAVVGMSESLALAVSKYDISVSVLCPGPVDTNIIANTNGTSHSERTGRALAQSAAFLKTGASIDDVGEMVVDGMERRAMWIHTGDSMGQWIRMRMEGLLDSIPRLDVVEAS